MNISAQQIELQGNVKIIDGTQGADKVLVSDANGLAQWKTPPSLFPENPDVGDMVYWNGNNWVTIPAGTQNQNLTFCNNKPVWGPCPSSSLLEDQTYTITQTWSQETDFDRNVYIEVPEGEGPFPAVILLHGAGGNGAGFINAFNYLGTDIIRIAPDGYMNGWNVAYESSKAPDVEFVTEIINYIKTFSNVDTNNISIIGSSNGSSMANRLLVELPAGTINNAVCIISPKVEKFYNNNNFYYDPTGGNVYDSIIVPANDRRILAVSGTADPIVPYLGGTGILGYEFLAAQNSIFIWAQNKGFMGTQIADSDGIPHPNNADLVEYSYLSGDIIHYKLIDGTHGTTGGNAQVKEVIVDFLGF